VEMMYKSKIILCFANKRGGGRERVFNSCNLVAYSNRIMGFKARATAEKSASKAFFKAQKRENNFY